MQSEPYFKKRLQSVKKFIQIKTDCILIRFAAISQAGGGLSLCVVQEAITHFHGAAAFQFGQHHVQPGGQVVVEAKALVQVV